MEILASKGPLSATDICDRFDASPPAISQHLKALRDARLVRIEKRGRQRIYTIDPGGMLVLEEWAVRTRERWSERFDRLDSFLEVGKKKKYNYNYDGSK